MGQSTDTSVSCQEASSLRRSGTQRGGLGERRTVADLLNESTNALGDTELTVSHISDIVSADVLWIFPVV